MLFISLLFLLPHLSAQEKISPSKRGTISIGYDISGPIISALDSTLFNSEFTFSYRLNQKYYITIEPGISRYSYKQYNYSYTSGGFFLRAGFDANLLKEKSNPGNHYAGIGLRYGISLFNQESISGSYTNYWGTYDFSVPKESVSAHFIELNGGVRAEVFKNILIGWTARARILIYQSAGKNNKPVYIPGMGINRSGMHPGFSFNVVWILPLKLSHQ